MDIAKAVKIRLYQSDQVLQENHQTKSNCFYQNCNAVRIKYTKIKISTQSVKVSRIISPAQLQAIKEEDGFCFFATDCVRLLRV